MATTKTISAIFNIFLIPLLVQANYHDPKCQGERAVIVHLFEWKWTDIAAECERFLGPRGYCGVQVSPPNEHRIIWQPSYNRNIKQPWYERYQPVSYKLVSRSGNEDEFRDMVDRCNSVGVRIYVDAIINHMAGDDAGRGQGTAGSKYDTQSKTFEAVPYYAQHFNDKSKCSTGNGIIQNYGDPRQVRNCNLLGLLDLDLEQEYVRNKIATYLNRCIDIGVAGFRFDAAKHMWPGDLHAIYGRLKNLNSKYFGENKRPFVMQEVIDLGGEPITSGEYKQLGKVTEFKYGQRLGNIIRRRGQLKNLRNFGQVPVLSRSVKSMFCYHIYIFQAWGMLPDKDALVFIDNHDNQRGHGAGGFNVILTYFESRMYKIANAFMLAWPYGMARVMSSYQWPRTIQGSKDKNDWMGPPHNSDYSTKGVNIKPDGSCDNGWICEHRWRQIANMAYFRKVVSGTQVSNWWDNGNNQIAFSRGSKGFIAINNEGRRMDVTVQTEMVPGEYCDVISSNPGSSTCKTVTVDGNRRVHVVIDGTSDDPIIAIHADSRVRPPAGGPDPHIGPFPSSLKPQSQRPLAGWQRTVVFMRAETKYGQNLFIRGGLSHYQRNGCGDKSITGGNSCFIPIRHRSVPNSHLYREAAAWQQNDNLLDWLGAQSGQGQYNGLSADGTPMLWTTNRQNDPGYNTLNSFGSHYWMMDVDMDCSKTHQGWFEVKGRLNKAWEGKLNQDDQCHGTAPAQGTIKPYQTSNHIALCGKINIFTYNSNECTINNF